MVDIAVAIGCLLMAVIACFAGCLLFQLAGRVANRSSDRTYAGKDVSLFAETRAMVAFAALAIGGLALNVGAILFVIAFGAFVVHVAKG